MFKKIAIRHRKGDFFKIKRSICNIPIEAANICNVLPTSAVSSELIVIKLKRDLNYKGHLYNEPVCPHFVYQALTYLKSYDKFYDDISIANVLVEIQGQSEHVTEKMFQMENK